MSWDRIEYDEFAKCKCGKGKVIRHMYRVDDDWNRTREGCIIEKLDCPECSRKYHIEHYIHHYSCMPWDGDGISDRVFLVPNGINNLIILSRRVNMASRKERLNGTKNQAGDATAPSHSQKARCSLRSRINWEGHYSNDKYRKIVWRCNNKYDNAIRCTTPSLTEQELLKLAFTALDSALQNKDEIIENCRLGIAAIADIASLDIAIETSAQYLESLAMQCRDLIKTTSRNIQVQDEYLEKYAALKEKYDQAQEKHDELEKKRADMLYKRSILEKFANDFSEFPPEQRLNKTLMVKLVNEIIIFSDGRVIVEMKNGMQITTQQ